MNTKMKRMNRKEVTDNQIKYEKQKSRRMGEGKNMQKIKWIKERHEEKCLVFLLH